MSEKLNSGIDKTLSVLEVYLPECAGVSLADIVKTVRYPENVGIQDS